jgi:hypothetical protein
LVLTIALWMLITPTLPDDCAARDKAQANPKAGKTNDALFTTNSLQKSGAVAPVPYTLF